REGAVGLGDRGPVGDLLGGPAMRRDAPPEAVVEPDRPADFAGDSVADLGPVDRGPGIRGRLAGDRDLAVELRRLLGRLDRYLELGPLVLLDVERDHAAAVARDDNVHLPREPVTRRCEAAAERPEVIAHDLLLGDFLAVRVVEYDRSLPAGEHLVIVPPRVGKHADALVVNRLPRPVQGAVREQDGVGIWSVMLVAGVVRVLVGRRQLVAVVAGQDEVAAIVVGADGEQAVLVGLRRRARGDSPVVLPHPGADDGTRERVA